MHYAFSTVFYCSFRSCPFQRSAVIFSYRVMAISKLGHATKGFCASSAHQGVTKERPEHLCVPTPLGTFMHLYNTLKLLQ